MRKPYIYGLVTSLRRRSPCIGRLGVRVRQVCEGVIAVEKIGLSGIGVDGDEIVVEQAGL